MKKMILIKKIIRQFIPNGLIVAKKYLSLQLKKKKKYFSTIAQINPQKQKLLAIGNGPSFKLTDDECRKVKDTYELFVVNGFCETDYYCKLKPEYYLFADVAFFGDYDTYAEYSKKNRLKLIATLVERTTWPIKLIIPSGGKNSFFVSEVEKNPNIQVLYCNTRNFTLNKDKNFALWDKNLQTVPTMNILNYALYLGIFLRFKEIYLIGADMSFSELVYVNQKTNQVYTKDKHFYDEKERPVYSDAAKTIPARYGEVLESIAIALNNFWVLKDYADYAGVKVYNASEYSLIDAFERKKL